MALQSLPLESWAAASAMLTTCADRVFNTSGRAIEIALAIISFTTMSTLQTPSMIEHDDENISDKHHMVSVIVKKYAEEKHSDAAKPKGSTEHRTVVLKATQPLKKRKGGAERINAATELTGSTERKGAVLKRAPTGTKPIGTAGFVVHCR